MEISDKKRFKELMLCLAENFSAQITIPGLRLRFEALKGYDIDRVEAAAVRLMSFRKWYGLPTVAEFLEALDREQLLEGDIPLSQVNEVMKEVRQTGAYGTPEFKDPKTKLLMSTRWTFRELCSMTESDLRWWAKAFVEAYQAMDRVENWAQIECNGAQMRKVIPL
ncbi:MAG: hypothetical protein WA151_11950 [Desulfatirhabdiaceae bacterium]